MNLAAIIDKKTSYLDLHIDNINTHYPTETIGSGGTAYRIVRSGLPESAIECTVEDMARFNREVHIGHRVKCRCVFNGVPADKEYLIEFVPIDIYYYGKGGVSVRCHDYLLIEV